jgi:hypothetical protein
MAGWVDVAWTDFQAARGSQRGGGGNFRSTLFFFGNNVNNWEF